jgi:lipoprotein-anchoring transpeptidase ErfK/SrfK
VRPVTILFLMIGNVVATQAFADDNSPQPLTRADCTKAAIGWSWNDNANVCESSSQKADGVPKSQPLTRNECNVAGVWWNDRANVCGEKSEAATQADSKTTNPVASTIVINIDKTKQEMTVFVDGVERYHWPVSTGRAGYSTPSGTFTPTSMNEVWYSKEWDNAPMPHAIFFMKDGHAIHGSYEVKHLGKAVSHGCVRISPQNATALYDLVKKNGTENTQVVLSGKTPGGEGVVTSSARSRARYGQAVPHSFRPGSNYYAESDDQPRKRGGFFRRLFGGP